MKAEIREDYKGALIRIIEKITEPGYQSHLIIYIRETDHLYHYEGSNPAIASAAVPMSQTSPLANGKQLSLMRIY